MGWTKRRDTKQMQFRSSGGRSTRSELLDVHDGSSAIGFGAGRPRPVLGELSAEAKAARAPLRPEELVEALHDRVHRDLGRTRAARTVRNSRRGTT